MEFVFHWENIGYEVKVKKGGFFKNENVTKTILHKVSGSATSNKLIAVLGPSGAGKSTFVSALAGKLKGKSGKLKLNSIPVTDSDIQSISAFIQQDDVFTASLTVYEHMQFMTALKLDEPQFERKIIIKNVLDELGLASCAQTKIETLSGGEKRRLSLATELISNPHILFCDEITTGLDSFSAITVVRSLEAIAKNGKIVMLIVHQPSSQLFDLFTDIILLANGKLIYEGSAQNAIKFFESANLFCPINFSVPDFYLKCLTIYPNNEKRDEERINILAFSFTKMSCSEKSNRPSKNTKIPILNKYTKRSKLYQFKWLLWRKFIDFRRNTDNFKANFLTAMVTACLICIIFNETTETSVQNIQGAFSLMVAEMVFNQMYYVLYDFPSEITILVNEKKLYDTFPYFVSKIFSVLPVNLISSCSLLASYVITLEYLQKLDLIFTMWYFFVLSCLGGTSIGLCLSAFIMDIEYSGLIIVPLQLILMIVSGLWIKITNMPLWLKVIKYFSPFFLSFEGISVAYWDQINDLGNCTAYSPELCYKSGQQVLERYGFVEDYDVTVVNAGILTVITTFYFVLGYIGIRRRR